jgi:hypothetical protein
MTSAETEFPVSQRYDLRKVPFNDAAERVQQALAVTLDLDRAVVKRRSVGAKTGRGTWVRMELRGLERLDGQGWGLEAAAVLHDVPAPAWRAGIAWYDPGRKAMWRADETDFIGQSPVGRASEASALPESWWRSLRAALEALERHQVSRRATPDCEPITQERVTAGIERVFPGGADTSISAWAPAHADFNWSNVTGPELRILDWEDWGMAPRGTDAARLWFVSLSEPALARKVRKHLAAALESRDGRIMALFECAGWLAYASDSEPRTALARAEAERLITELAA